MAFPDFVCQAQPTHPVPAGLSSGNRGL